MLSPQRHPCTPHESIKLLKYSNCITINYYQLNRQKKKDQKQEVNDSSNLASFILPINASSGFIRSLLRASLRTFKSSINQSFLRIKVEEEISSRHRFIEQSSSGLTFQRNHKLYHSINFFEFKRFARKVNDVPQPKQQKILDCFQLLNRLIDVYLFRQ